FRQTVYHGRAIRIPCAYQNDNVWEADMSQSLGTTPTETSTSQIATGKYLDRQHTKNRSLHFARDTRGQWIRALARCETFSSRVRGLGGCDALARGVRLVPRVREGLNKSSGSVRM